MRISDWSSDVCSSDLTLYPERINNKTNGITFRRWLFQANAELTSMMVDALGPSVLDNPEERLIELGRSQINRHSANSSPNSACTAKRPWRDRKSTRLNSSH